MEQIHIWRALAAPAEKFFFASSGRLKKKLLHHSPCLGLPRTTAMKPPKQNAVDRYISNGLVLANSQT